MKRTLLAFGLSLTLFIGSVAEAGKPRPRPTPTPAPTASYEWRYQRTEIQTHLFVKMYCGSMCWTPSYIRKSLACNATTVGTVYNNALDYYFGTPATYMGQGELPGETTGVQMALSSDAASIEYGYGDNGLLYEYAPVTVDIFLCVQI